jgi:hypothetical protein
MSWSELPTNLRTVLGAALLLVIGVAVASFTLSFIALREVASASITGWGKNAWIFPLCVDAALLASEVVLVGVSMVKGVNRAVPFVFMVLFGALTVWFNVARVPADWRLVTGVPPVAGIFMTLLLSFLMKVLALATGKAMIYEAPPPQAGYLMAPQTIVSRLPDGTYGVQGPPQMLAPAPQVTATTSLHENGQNGRPALGSGMSKRRLVDQYLDGLSTTELQAITARQVARDLTERGYPVTERTVVPVLRAHRARR